MLVCPDSGWSLATFIGGEPDMKKTLSIAAVIGLLATPALAGFASGPVTPAKEEAPAAAVVDERPKLDGCKGYCNIAPGLFSGNMADDATIRANCPADSIARGGTVVYELLPKN